MKSEIRRLRRREWALENQLDAELFQVAGNDGMSLDGPLKVPQEQGRAGALEAAAAKVKASMLAR